MKSLGLNYTFQTLIVIDKTPVARTNDGRLAPLQAALQEEKERDFKSTMQSAVVGGKKRRAFIFFFHVTFLLIVPAIAPLKSPCASFLLHYAVVSVLLVRGQKPCYVTLEKMFIFCQ